MRVFRNALAIMAIAIASVSISAAPAFAQAAPNAVILVVDFDRLVTESLAGRDATAQVEDYIAKAQARRQQLADKLQGDQEKLAKQRAILKEEDFQRRAVQFQNEVQKAENELRQKQVGAQRAVQQARNEILRQVRPIVRKQMKKRRANIVTPKSVAFDFLESLDITTSVLQELNKEVPKLKVALPSS